MKTIKIAHLYYDLMNLYGENGNVLCLKKYLEKQDVKVDIIYLTKNDNIDFNEYDIFYIGSGNDSSFNIALEDLKQYKEKLKDIIENKLFIATGNSLNLFGKTYVTKEKTIDCLDILDYSSKQIKKRLVGEQLYKTNLIKDEIIGFENRDSMLINVKEKTLFDSIKGFGNSKNEKFEGIIHNNFYGTYLLGPLLIRNPYFTNYLIKELCTKLEIEFKEYYNNYEIKAYENYKQIINNN